MSKKILIIAGWGGSDFPHWQSWLAGELAKDYGCVNFLKFNDFEYPNLSMWKSELEVCIKNFKPDIVICHSLANILWFHLCNEGKLQEIQKLYLVAPPSLTCDIKELQSFYPIDLPKKLFSKETLLITSTDDPYMTKDEAKKIQISLGVKMEILQDGGHINADSGFGEWKWILKKVKS